MIVVEGGFFAVDARGYVEEGAGETMGVVDDLKFKVGDKDILFVQNNGSQFAPLVGIMNGRFHVRTNESASKSSPIT